MSETPKKKRGRKPKNKIISNPDPVFDSNSLDDILITCIKKPKNEIIIEEDNVKPNDVSENNFLEYEHKNNNKCWNCSYDIEGEVYSYPVSYYNNVFNVNGNFCCYECAGRYIYENYNDKEFWDKYYLLNFYVNIKLNKNTKVKIPYSKLRLIDYGGDLTKQEYIDSENITYDCYIPPTVYVNNLYYSKDIKNTKEGEFKLFRKNKRKNNFLKNLT
tara:strand:- start:210 stop:857 length:648 start_codon:yes stop_codon:yes gene_type:complete